MLNSIAIKNFKAFGKKATIPLTPLTILSGPNNSGKSSLLHALLILKQTHESDSDYPLCAVGRYGSFGAYRELAHDRALRTLDITLNLLLPQEIPLEFAGKAFGVSKHGMRRDSRIDLQAHLGLSFTEDADNECGFKLGNSTLKLTIPEAKRNPSLVWNSKKILNVRDTQGASSLNGASLHLLNFWPNHIEKKGGVYGPSLLPAIFNGAMCRMQRYFDDISYLGPLREDPHRYYLLDKEFVSDLGPRGENTWNALAHSPVRRVSFFDLKRHGIREMSLLDAVNWWLRYCGIADQIKTKKRSGDPIYQVLLRGSFKGTKSIVDLGFGVSQILPVLVMGLLGGRDGLQLYEQPEIHVHPAIQAQLADFFMSIAKSGRQVLLETHSEHIINRIRTRILEEKVRQDEISILFLGKDSKYNSTFEKIKFRGDGQIANWPPGFFDTHIGEVKAQNKALRKRISSGA